MSCRGLTLVLATCVYVLTASRLVACLWDADTMWEASRQFPDVAELIVGDFLRHTPEYYRWRINDRKRKLAHERRPEWYDDIAVAHDKLGEHEEALRVVEEQARYFPGRYETEANWGTFLFHAGRLEEGLPHIAEALRINPSAHFGRERYQKWLVEYVLERKQGGCPAPPYGRGGPTFADFLQAKLGRPLAKADLKEAEQGLSGMLRFGNFRSPVLLEALASVLDPKNPPRDYNDPPRLIIGSVYLLAAAEVEDPAARDYFRELAQQSLHKLQRRDESRLTLAQIESELAAFSTQVAARQMRFEAEERRLLASSANPEPALRELAEKRLTLLESERQQAEAAEADRLTAVRADERIWLHLDVLRCAGCLVLLCGLIATWFRLRSPREPATPHQPPPPVASPR